MLGFPGSSADKETACNAGDPGLIPGSGSLGEGIGYPLQYSWVFLVAQTVKNRPAMQETWVRSLGWEDPPEEVMATHGEGNGNPLQYSCLGNSWRATVHGIPKSQTWVTHSGWCWEVLKFDQHYLANWGGRRGILLLFEIYWTSHKGYISEKWHLGSVLPSTSIKFRTDTRTLFLKMCGY